MPPVNPPAKMVMIEDENGIQQPWPIIPRPEIIPKNPNIKKLMELGSGANPDEDEDEDEDKDENETTKAQEVIYRSIWSGIKSAMNAIVPSASRGKLMWKQVTSEQRTDVLENNPYLRRFEGGWIEELIMRTQLTNARETRRRRVRKASESQLKPLNQLSKQTKKQSIGSHKTKVSTSPAQNSNRKLNKTPNKEPNKKSNNPSNSGEQSNTQRNAQPTTTSNKKRSAANNDGQESGLNDEVLGSGEESDKESDKGSDKGSDDEMWNAAVNAEVISQKSKKQGGAQSGSSSATKKGKTLPENSSASTVRAKRPKVRPPPNASADEGEDTTTKLFRRNTRAAKQEAIEKVDFEVEAEAEGKNKGKSVAKDKKKTNSKKKAKK